MTGRGCREHRGRSCRLPVPRSDVVEPAVPLVARLAQMGRARTARPLEDGRRGAPQRNRRAALPGETTGRPARMAAAAGALGSSSGAASAARGGRAPRAAGRRRVDAALRARLAARAGRAGDGGGDAPRRPRHRHVVRRAGGVRRSRRRAALRQRAPLPRRPRRRRSRSSTSTPPTPACCVLEDVGDMPLWDAVQGQPDAADRGPVRARHRPAAAHPDRRHRAARRRAASPSSRRSTGACSTGSSSTSSSTVWSNRAAAPIPSQRARGAARPLRPHRRAFLDAPAARAQPPRLPRLESVRAGRAASASSTSRTRCSPPAPYDLATLLGDRDTPPRHSPRARAAPARRTTPRRWAARGGAPWQRERAVGRLRRLRPAEGVQGRRPLPLSRHA